MTLPLNNLNHFIHILLADVVVLGFHHHPDDGFRAGLPAAEEMDASRVEDARNHARFGLHAQTQVCLLYTSDAADE